MKKTLIALLLTLGAGMANADSNVITLWPEGVPGAKAIGPEKIGGGYNSNVTDASLTRIGPAVDRPNGTAVIICPGGGYVRMSTAREGEQYGNWLSTLGVTAYVLKYRMQEYGHLPRCRTCCARCAPCARARRNWASIRRASA